MEYRKDIQILRGIAILLVLLFHLETPGFGAGFLGVDAFFVVSGFLMACLYGTGGAARFFERRAKRILPAYFLILLATLVAAAVLTLPPDLASVSGQALYAALLVPNIGFWMENSYFAKDTFKPLLHLWSLGVEIQFYLLVPLIAWLARRFRLFVPLAIAASLACCLLAVGVSPKTAFFMLPFRLWQFLLGYFVATTLTERGRPARRNAMVSWPALAALPGVPLLAPLLGLDGDALGPLHGHPGLAALALCLAVAALLVYGFPDALTRSRAGNALETLGKYSYSVYLVHFPVIALALYEPFGGTRLGAGSAAVLTAMLAAIALLSVLVYRHVEAPLRQARYRWRLAAGSVPVAIALTASGAPSVATAFFPDDARRIFAAAADRDVYRCGKLARLLHPRALTCALTEGDPAGPRILLVGNSHADAIKAAVAVAAREIRATLRFVVPNDPLISDAYNPHVVVAAALRRRIDLIVVHFSPGALPFDTVRALVDLAAQHDIRVSYIAPVPIWEVKVPKALYEHLRDGKPLPQQDLAAYDRNNRDVLAAMRGIDTPGFAAYEPASLMCRSACRLTDDGGAPLYFDTQHLTLTGSAQLMDLFRAALSNARRHDG